MNHIMPEYRILYVGLDLALLKYLQGTLGNCKVVRCPGGSSARLLIASEINYALLLFDDEMPDATGAKLKRFARKLAHREHTPIIIIKKADDYDSLVKDIIRSISNTK